MNIRAKKILDYWFADLDQTPAYFSERMPFWFMGGKKVDDAIRKHFNSDLEAAVKGELKSWENNPREALALIILLDQFSLNLYREQPRSYDQSRLALPLAKRLIQKKIHLLLTPIERCFVYLPFEHSENLKDQMTSVKLFTELYQAVPTYAKKEFAGTLDYAKRHARVVKKYGRFPDRNEVYGRKSTAAEERFLASEQAPF